MKVLFDFEINGDPDMDSHLLDVLLACKRDIVEYLSAYKKDIETEGGYILISSLQKMEGIGIKYHFKNDEAFAGKINQLIKEFDLWKTIKVLGKEKMN